MRGIIEYRGVSRIWLATSQTPNYEVPEARHELAWDFSPRCQQRDVPLLQCQVPEARHASAWDFSPRCQQRDVPLLQCQVPEARHELAWDFSPRCQQRDVPLLQCQVPEARHASAWDFSPRCQLFKVVASLVRPSNRMGAIRLSRNLTLVSVKNPRISVASSSNRFPLDR